MPVSRSSLRTFVSALLLMVFGAPVMSRAEAPKFEAADPFKVIAPGLARLAKEVGIELGAEHYAGSTEPGAGDTLVFWCQACDGPSRQQWLIRFRRHPAPPGKVEKSREIPYYVSWSGEVRFNGAPTPIDLWIAGPVSMDSAETAARTPPVHTALVEASRDFLSLGLDRTALVNMKLQKTLGPDGKPPPWMDIRLIYAYSNSKDTTPNPGARALGKRIGLTDDDARAWAGGLLSLGSFFQTAVGVSSVRGMASGAVVMPSVWTMIKMAAGKTGPNIAFSAGAIPLDYRWLNAPAECYVLPFNVVVDDKLVTMVGATVTAPKPPLDLSAGIVAFAAMSPKDHDHTLQVTLVAVQR